MSKEKPRIEISAAQVAGGALAAASAAVAASVLGVAGTVIGAAVASIVTTVGSAMYTHSMRRGRYALQQARTTRLRHLGRLPAPQPVQEVEAAEATRNEQEGDATNAGRRNWFRGLNARAVAITAACVLVLALGAITGAEALLGKPISSALGGGDDPKGTSIGALAGSGHRTVIKKTRKPGSSSTPTPTVTTTVTRSPAATPTQPTQPTQPSSASQTSRTATTGGTSHAPTPAPSTSPASPRSPAPGDVRP